MRLNKAVTLCFIGIDGAGKGTLIKKLEEHYKTTAKQRYVYFGWKPFLPTTKVLSSSFKKKKYKITEAHVTSFSIIKELMLAYMVFEYAMRYIIQILPFTYMRRMIFIDRYIYDLYAHIPYASRSKWFMKVLQVFPQPDFIFYLDIDPQKAYERKPESTIEQLEKHRAKYNYLYKWLPLRRIDTAQTTDVCIKEIDAQIHSALKKFA